MNFTEFLYQHRLGRCLLKVLIQPSVSQMVGRWMDSSFSKCLISPFIRHYHLRMDEYQKKNYSSFNEFFCRKIKPERRPVDESPESFISPCDGLLSIYPIRDGLVIPVKQSEYSIPSLLRNKKLAKSFEGGNCVVLRLCVDHYHRYCYVDSGMQEQTVKIPGVLHTVRPVALLQHPVFKENAREYTLIHTENFGDLLQMEVGAMLVGRIVNSENAGSLRRGAEKGYFQYGGSTIILLTQKSKVSFSEKLYRATERGIEIPVKMGMKIGRKAK